MPILNFRAETTTEGKTLPAPSVFRDRGPIVPVELMVSDAHQEVLKQQQNPIPDPMKGFALIDTGALSTCLDISTAEIIGLPVCGTTEITSASHTVEVPIFVGKLVLPDFININVQRGAGVNLKGLGKYKEFGTDLDLIALIGRDILEIAILVYNGPGGSFSLSI